MSANPYVFLVGCARSGTSLLRRMVDSHPELAIARESHWIPTYFQQRVGLDPDGRVTPALVEELVSNPRFQRMKLTRRDLQSLLASRPNHSYASFISGMFDTYAKQRGKRYAGDKTPGYVKQMPALHALWPQARFIHLIRDGRDVCRSLLSWKAAGRGPGRFRIWEKERVATAALWWEWHVRMGREAGRELGARYYELRYENLISDPGRACRELCSFLGLAYDDAMLRPHAGRTRERGSPDKRAWEPPTRGFRDWRTDMPEADQALFEAIAGDLLEEIDYATTGAGKDPALRGRAVTLRANFATDERARRFGIPGAWRAAMR